MLYPTELRARVVGALRGQRVTTTATGYFAPASASSRKRGVSRKRVLAGTSELPSADARARNRSE